MSLVRSDQEYHTHDGHATPTYHAGSMTHLLFTPEQDIALREKHEARVSLSRLAEQYGVHRHTIREAVRRAGGTVAGPGKAPTLSDAEVVHIHSEILASDLSTSAFCTANGLSQHAVRYGFRRLHLRVPLRYARGATHGNWLGGEPRWGDYVAVYVDPAHPFFAMGTPASRGERRYVLKHRFVMAEMLGRPLSAKETVHHIDGDKRNNVIGNLQLRNGNHGPGQRWQCGDCKSHNIEAVAL